MNEDREYSVLHRLPDHGQRVLCYGHKTYCCKSDMEDEPAWHEATFIFCVQYVLKKEMPEDVEASIMEDSSAVEIWEITPNQFDGHVIGVTKWKKIAKESE